MMSEGKQTKITHYMIPFIWYGRNYKLIYTNKKCLVTWQQEWCREKTEGGIAKGNEGTFRGVMDTFLMLIVVMFSHTYVET